MEAGRAASGRAGRAGAQERTTHVFLVVSELVRQKGASLEQPWSVLPWLAPVWSLMLQQCARMAGQRGQACVGRV